MQGRVPTVTGLNWVEQAFLALILFLVALRAVNYSELVVYSCPCHTQEASEMQQVHERVPTTPTALRAVARGHQVPWSAVLLLPHRSSRPCVSLILVLDRKV